MFEDVRAGCEIFDAEVDVTMSRWRTDTRDEVLKPGFYLDAGAAFLYVADQRIIMAIRV